MSRPKASRRPILPANDPREIVPASPEIADRMSEALAGHRFVPSGFTGLMGAYHHALATGVSYR